MSSITLLSPAKVNLTLEVLGTRPDGYHEIRSLIQPVDLFDEVKIETIEGEGIEISSSGIEIPRGRTTSPGRRPICFSGKAVSIQAWRYR